MNLSTCIILLLKCLAACSQVLMKSSIYLDCSADKKSEVFTVNGNELAYADYGQKKMVYTIPRFMVFDPSRQFEHIFSVKYLERDARYCRDALAIAKQEVRFPANIEDPPESVLYLAEELQSGQANNTLICFLDRFFPPDLQVHWSKNGEAVSEGATLSRYYHNEDLTFRILATLSFAPKEGDVYGCTVDHSALDKPKTVFLEVEFSHPGAGADVFCAAGLVVALLGFGSGVFLAARRRYATRV
ncbi:RLA class II histocompatibility antigen, DP alpha-1 chain-like [Syngnathoides biaculeatus]|uniref:RLA class II histocompatibility antigen, DP alpha-1 chain-like n=1 Tax=Syngnathoides biaculeatus TaxID=300417 RepID=UPI002ADDFDA6|nr:RLA class II histocompatibility antigen, DP alpha-1 chain-like [Syngnathoides biaculeatus]